MFPGEEGVDRVGSPGSRGGDRWACAGAEGPVISWVGLGLLVRGGRGPVRDPEPEGLGLGRGERLGLVLGRHAFLRVGVGNAKEQGAGLGLAGHEGGTGFAATLHEGGGVQAKTTLLPQGAMAGEAAFGEERTDLAGVIDGGAAAGGEEQANHQGRKTGQ